MGQRKTALMAFTHIRLEFQKEVHGEEQSDGEWCDQIMIWEDSGDGTYYYPIEGSNMYMYVKYSF